MSGGLDATALKEEDITKFLGCSTHLGASNVDFQMEQYVYKRKPEGISSYFIVKARENQQICLNTWSKLADTQLKSGLLKCIKNLDTQLWL